MALLKMILVVLLFSLVECDNSKPHNIEREERHYGHGHNSEVDQEAFLGKDHAHDYDDLSPEESKSKLSKLIKIIDRDNSKTLTQEELKLWIKVQNMDYIMKDAEKSFPDEDTDNSGMISWTEYHKNTYADEVEEDLQDMVANDKKRFEMADKNKDAALNLDEFTSFLHPEEFEDMADSVVDETIGDMDEDGDGLISMQEYVGESPEDDDEDDEDAPDREWVLKEKERFTSEDSNGDGFLDREEMKQWLWSSELNYAEEEAKHLIQQADSNKDGILAFSEVLEHYDVFVGSQATDYGRLLHEEL